MAQAVNIVLADAQATPVNHTFIPVGPVGGWDMVWEDSSRPSPLGYWRIFLKITPPLAAAQTPGTIEGAVKRATIRLSEPVLEAIAPAASGLTQPPTIAYEPRAEAVYILSQRSVVQDRKDLRKMFANLQNDPQVILAVESLITTW